MRILIRYFFRALRVVLTPFLLLGDKLTTPKGMERDPAEQARVDAETENLALYQFPACPFCIKARRTIQRLGLNIELRNAQPTGDHRKAPAGRRRQAPGPLPAHRPPGRASGVDVRVRGHRALPRGALRPARGQQELLIPRSPTPRPSYVAGSMEAPHPKGGPAAVAASHAAPCWLRASRGRPPGRLRPAAPLQGSAGQPRQRSRSPVACGSGRVPGS
jgi:hypothetical protein